MKKRERVMGGESNRLWSEGDCITRLDCRNLRKKSYCSLPCEGERESAVQRHVTRGQRSNTQERQHEARMEPLRLFVLVSDLKRRPAVGVNPAKPLTISKSDLMRSQCVCV